MTTVLDEGADLWKLVYEPLGWFRELDEEGSGHLRLYLEALLEPLQETWDLVRPRLDRVGYDIALDPDEAPADGLAWLSQFPGVELTPEMSEQQQRDEIREPTGWGRGQDPAIQVATRRTLRPVVEGEELLVILRANDPEPGRTYARTLVSQTPEPARTERVLREKLPWWTRLDYAAISGVSVHDVALGKRTTVAALAAGFPTVRSVAEVLPSEI